ncbi:MAG: hypothetical protein IPH93_15165 [Saprospiraceae bacterium]|nr:hypothetical protein [Saprospiraceae bacterium]
MMAKVYPHEFVVYSTEEKNTIESLIHEYKTSLPIKTLEFAKDELINILKEQDSDNKKLLVVWEEFCWNKWYKGDSTNTKLDVDITKPKSKKINGDNKNLIEAIYLDHLYSDTNETPQKCGKKKLMQHI